MTCTHCAPVPAHTQADLTEADWSVLADVVSSHDCPRGDGLTIREIAAETPMTWSDVSAAVDRLASLHLVWRSGLLVRRMDAGTLAINAHLTRRTAA